MQMTKGQLLIYRMLMRVLRMISLDARSLALFRILIALTTISDVMTRFPDAHHHYSDAGMFPREFILRSFTNYYWITVHFLSGSAFVMQLLFILEIAIALLMLVGYRTRTMTVISWILVCSVQNRNYILGHSGDTVHRLFLFWAIFLPLGRYCSVDRALEEAAAPSRAHKWEDTCDPDVGEEYPRESNEKRKSVTNVVFNSRSEVANFATAAFTVQLLVMYYMAHHHKTGPEWRERGVAAWMALQLDYFRTWFGDILLWWTPGVIFANFAVLRWQHYGSMMYFMPFYNEYFKAFVIFGFFAMHAGFGMAFYLETFTWATMAAVCGAIPGWVWDVAQKYAGKLSPFSNPIQIHISPNYEFGKKLAYILDQLMLPGKSRIVFTSKSSLPCACGNQCNYGDAPFLGMYVTDQHKTMLHNTEVVLTRSSPILYPLHYILRTGPAHMVTKWISHFFYNPSQYFLDDEEAGNPADSKFSYRPHPDSEIGEFSGVVVESGVSSPLRTSSVKKEFFADQSGSFTVNDIRDASKIGLRAIKEAFVAFLLVLIICTNAGNVNNRYAVSSSLQPVLWVFQLDQYWGMFAPRPPDITWWYNFEGYLDDGTHVEMFNNGALHTFIPNIPYTSDKPDVHESIGNHRWFKLFENGINSHAQREEIRLYFGRWFCREYNSRYSGSQRLHKYSIHFVFERLDMAKLDGSRFPAARETVWNHLCYEK